ncbi:uncharacterized protein J3R85_005175 [Psidium guajava]|nr:uncharacterized protein J3R85_005175 [Psidium guajava]
MIHSVKAIVDSLIMRRTLRLQFASELGIQLQQQGFFSVHESSVKPLTLWELVFQRAHEPPRASAFLCELRNLRMSLSLIPFAWEGKPGILKCKASDQNGGDDDDDFEFDFCGQLEARSDRHRDLLKGRRWSKKFSPLATRRESSTPLPQLLNQTTMEMEVVIPWCSGRWARPRGHGGLR